MATTRGNDLVLEAGDVRAVVATAIGGRVASFALRGRELIVTEGYGPIQWGCYPMVPFAGRVRRGRFEFRGRTYELETNMPPHAIHGDVLDRPWRVDDARALSIELGPRWPFHGRVVQRFDVEPDRFRATLELQADEPMPASIGWHPWFRRLAGHADGGGDTDTERPLVLDFQPDSMFERDADGIPSGRLVAPKPRPWDDCFTDLRADPRLTWPGFVEVTIRSSCRYWVVYDETPHAICVEPQTAPPDALNLGPTIVEPGAPLVATMEWRWRFLGD